MLSFIHSFFILKTHRQKQKYKQSPPVGARKDFLGCEHCKLIDIKDKKIKQINFLYLIVFCLNFTKVLFFLIY